MSEDTRQRGMNELRSLDVIEVRLQVLSRSSADFRRARNSYVLHTERLARPPSI